MEDASENVPMKETEEERKKREQKISEAMEIVANAHETEMKRVQFKKTK